MTKRDDLYDTVTAKIIEQLEQGICPWAQPWDAGQAARQFSMPANAGSMREYSGINIILLWISAYEQKFTAQGWMTYKQAADLGAQVRKGETSTTVFYTSQFITKDEKQAAKEQGRKPLPRRYLKKFRVFNIAQIDGLEGDLSFEPEFKTERMSIEAADKVITETGADIREGGLRTYYSPTDDYIQMPDDYRYMDPVNRYRSLLHELTHWTGHHTRLGRFKDVAMKKQSYGAEELVAEIGAAFLCARLGIEPTVRHSDYIGAWLNIMKADNRAIFKAASAASKAAAFITKDEQSYQHKQKAA